MPDRLTKIEFTERAQEVVEAYCQMKGSTPEKLVDDWIDGMSREIADEKLWHIKDW